MTPLSPTAYSDARGMRGMVRGTDERFAAPQDEGVGCCADA